MVADGPPQEVERRVGGGASVGRAGIFRRHKFLVRPAPPFPPARGGEDMERRKGIYDVNILYMRAYVAAGLRRTRFKS